MAAARELNLYESQLYHWRSKQQNQLSSSEREQVISAESARLKRQLTERDEVLTIFQNGRDILCETPDGTGSHRGVQASGKFCCFGAPLLNNGGQTSSSCSRCSGLCLCIFYSLITSNNVALFNNTGGGLGVDLLR